jgi:DNA-binding NarL/FixJ family response regulator
VSEITIVICDDQQEIIEIWDDLLYVHPEITIVGKFLSPEEYKLSVQELNPSAAIIDIWFGAEAQGFELMEWTIRTMGIPVIIASVDRYDMERVVTSGASSFIYKPAPGDIATIIKKVTQGEKYFPDMSGHSL